MTTTADAAATDAREPGTTTDPVDVTLVNVPVQSLRTASPTQSPSSVSSPAGGPGVLARARADGVTGPAVVALATAVVAVGVALDLRLGSSVSFGTVLAVLAAAIAGPAVVRFRSLPTAAVLPPLLMAAAAGAIGGFSGQDHGTRELALDVGTTLALWAPALFAATVASVLVVLIRVGQRIIR